MKLRRTVIGTLLTGVLAGTAATATAALECKSVEGMDALLQAGNIVLLGEIHGTQESPRAVTTVVCAALDQGMAVTVGLEIPQSENKRIQKYMTSDGTPWDQVQLLEGGFWQRDYQDGRSSEAMLDLIETLREYRAQDKDLRVLVIDNSMAPDRDRFMAQWLHAAIKEQPERFFVTLTGNVHNRLTAADGQYARMGYHLSQRLPEANVIALKLTYASGSAWVCTPDGCGVQNLRGNSSSLSGIQLFDGPTDEGFSGSYDVGAIAASPPAKQR